MAEITGTLATFGLSSLVQYSPEIVFTPSGPAVSTSVLYASKPIIAVPNTGGAFTVTLAPTMNLNPEVWYSLSIRWLDPDAIGPDQGFIGVDFPDWKLRVPGEGGNLAELLNVPSNPGQVWVGIDPPTNVTPGTWWLNPNTGELYEWSN